ncbi:EF-hand calcium-binding domain-containing protein 5 [Bombina bombina]|uniref:EF-hand calcium-binding domain-containing protein 5 n=1 Tax=Bombina bombina TaxID=8345 RepID=UPI00235AFA65|nr:EF-hand calcium-binding domain-containing protein 5 [Bombina bombina]
MQRCAQSHSPPLVEGNKSLDVWISQGKMTTNSGSHDQTSISEHTVVDSAGSPVGSLPACKLNLSQKLEADWHLVFNDQMQQRGLKLQQETLERISHQRAKKEKLKKTSPPDELSREWFSDDKTTVETRAYLLDKLMPTIVPAVEAMLKQVEEKKAIEDNSVKFDPVNFLGEYLMRHNPDFTSDSEEQPYVRGLKEVVADLTKHVFDIKFNRLGQLKEEIKIIQEQREQVENIQVQVKQKRKEALAIQFQEWTLDTSGRIPLTLVQSALKSFVDDAKEYAMDNKSVYDKELETVDTTEKKLSSEEFVEYVYTYIQHFSTDLFQEFLHHLAQCADMFRETITHDIWRQMFSDVFLACDHGKVGFLDRQRVLALMETFYDNMDLESEECHLRNPRQWPMIELDEMDPTAFWANFQEGIKPVEKESTTDGSEPISTYSVAAQEKENKIESNVTVEGSTHTKEEASSTDDSGKQEKNYFPDKPWSGDLLTTDLALRYSSYGDRSEYECTEAASKFSELGPIITDINCRGPSRIPSAFNDRALSLPQFVQLIETFLGERTPFPVVKELTAFMQKEYSETEEERTSMLAKVRHDAIAAHQKLVLQALFEKWDNECTGFLNFEEVEAVLSKYKEGMESEVIAKGREKLSSSQSQRLSQRLPAPEFGKFILGVVSEIPGPENEVFENLVEFLTSSVERSQAEKLRGSSRRKWLQEIIGAAKTSGGSLETVYRAVFQALYKDAEAHGNNKKISANIGILEQSSTKKGSEEVLRYVACTSNDAKYVLNKTLHRDMKGVSFAAIYNGTPMHVPRVQYHGNIHFWNLDLPVEERKGSFIVLPLIDSQQRAFGTLGIDTMKDPRERNIFLTHEISFYQGVTNAFSIAFHHVQLQRGILQLVSSALAWIYSRAPNIRTINTYLMEPSADKTQDYAFRNMMRTDNNNGISEIYSNPNTLHRKDNIFRDYLFKCADSSEVVTTDAYGERHLAVPIRDSAGRAIGVLDLNTGHCRELPAHEYQDLQKMLQMLQEACNEILDEQQPTEMHKKPVLEAEQESGDRKLGFLFYRFMLQDLRQCVSKLDHQSFAELKSYNEPPQMVHNILKAVLLYFCPQWNETEEINSWNQCKLKVNSDLIRKILSFDPTALSVQVQPEILAKYIKGIPRGAVWKHGSVPAEHLYNWAFTCLSLLELTQKMRETQQSSLAALPVLNENPETMATIVSSFMLSLLQC